MVSEAFIQARQEREKSTCHKAQTGAVIVKDGKIIGRGHNMCSPSGEEYGERVKECKRMNVPTGTGYELCNPVHCEKAAGVDALRRGEDPSGGVMYLSGHYWACFDCSVFLKFLGVVGIEFDPEIAGEMKQKYQDLGLIKEEGKE